MYRPRNDEEIAKEIELLRKIKPHITQHGFFGNDNWRTIDLEIRILERDMTETELREYLNFEENDDAISHGERLFLDNDGYEVIQWMEGETEESPSSGWAHMVGKEVVNDQKEEKPKSKPGGTDKKSKGSNGKRPKKRRS